MAHSSPFSLSAKHVEKATRIEGRAGQGRAAGQGEMDVQTGYIRWARPSPTGAEAGRSSSVRTDPLSPSNQGPNIGTWRYGKLGSPSTSLQSPVSQGGLSSNKHLLAPLFVPSPQPVCTLHGAFPSTSLFPFLPLSFFRISLPVEPVRSVAKTRSAIPCRPTAAASRKIRCTVPYPVSRLQVPLLLSGLMVDIGDKQLNYWEARRRLGSNTIVERTSPAHLFTEDQGLRYVFLTRHIQFLSLFSTLGTAVSCEHLGSPSRPGSPDSLEPITCHMPCVPIMISTYEYLHTVY